MSPKGPSLGKEELGGGGGVRCDDTVGKHSLLSSMLSNQPLSPLSLGYYCGCGCFCFCRYHYVIQLSPKCILI